MVSELSDKVVEAIPALKEAASELAHQAAEDEDITNGQQCIIPSFHKSRE